ncbi:MULTISPECIES: hypothetical protein [unclassified Rhizobium]|uniref:hypothetical protein n=1 Tax=unclassified Rhizobium TaxID=2613769 RepID=UPI00178407B1|nr:MULTISPECIES: hypothetical protein [unclassified Rhizobium]MBD8687013.1 hypothetical protein [Rhizobium sp. CFBP 13644]MBD8691184.1 hypothetical protein [Rhizobium sp. CFBP 13717]
MAVLHHAFRCAVTADFERDLQNLMREWASGDRGVFADVAKARYAGLAHLENINTAFYLGPGGAAPSWLEPAFISAGLAAFVMLAPDLEPLPSLSASHDTNHALLARHLPALGWSEDEFRALIYGWPIETVLQRYVRGTSTAVAGGFAHTGGWTPPGMTDILRERLDILASGRPAKSHKLAEEALHALKENNAFEDAQKMLAHLDRYDWLVMAITH